MTYDKQVTGEVVSFRIQGELDALSAAILRSAFEDVSKANARDVELDLGELELIDSSGAGVIVWLYKQLRRRGAKLRVAHLTGQPRMVFELLGLDRVFQIH